MSIAADLPAKAHLDIQAAFQRYVDNAVSKTINLPADATPDESRVAELLAEPEHQRLALPGEIGNDLHGREGRSLPARSKTARRPPTVGRGPIRGRHGRITRSRATPEGCSGTSGSGRRGAR